MKIISKYKDYYDYLAGTYGVDPLLVLDRRDSKDPKFFDFEIKKLTLYICDKKIEGLFYKGKFYYGDKIEPFAIVPTESSDKYFQRYFKTSEKYIIKLENTTTTLSINKFIEDSDINTKLKCPILMYDYGVYTDIKNFYKFPILSKLELAGILSAESIWLMLSQFLAIKEEPAAPITNNNKIIAAGFDLKTSFRGK